MILTKSQILDLFCRFHRFDERKLQGETRVEFLARINKKFDLESARRQYEADLQEIKATELEDAFSQEDI